MKNIWRILIALICVMLLWFCFEMMKLEKYQNEIDQLQLQKEENDREYERLMKEVNEVLDDGNNI